MTATPLCSRLSAVPGPLKLARPDTSVFHFGTSYGGKSTYISSADSLSKDAADNSDPDLADSSDPDLEDAEEEQVIFEKNNESEDRNMASKPKFLLMIATFFSLLDYHFARFGDMLLCRFFRKRSIIDIFMVGMTFVGFMLLLAPEIMYEIGRAHV